MSDPVFTPEMHAACLAAAQAARNEPETVEGLRAQLDAMAALCRETAEAQTAERAAADKAVAELRAQLAASQAREVERPASAEVTRAAEHIAGQGAGLTEEERATVDEARTSIGTRGTVDDLLAIIDRLTGGAK